MIDDRRAYLRACWIGALAAIVLFAGVLAMSGVGFHSSEYTTNFHTEQMRSLAHLHWNMRPNVLGIEGFERGGRWYMYYGPFPSLFRLPFLVVWPSEADRITQWSMLAGFILALRAVGLLLWRVRSWFRADQSTDRRERVGAGAMVFLAGAGSSLLFLGTNAWIYHETEIWGAALALGAYEAILAVVATPTRRRVLVASAWTAAAILTRGSVGIGPVAALAMLGAVGLVARLRPRLGLDPGLTRRTATKLIVAAVVPMALYCIVNEARFANPIVFPTDRQRMSQINPQRMNFLSHSGGSYFGLQFIPTTLLQYFRPDALTFERIAPFIDFPRHGHVVGDAVFDAFEPTSSIPSSMPALTVLTIVGIGAVVGTSRRRCAPIRAPIVGAAIGAAAVLPFGYIANRYLADFVPLLVLCSVVGFHRLSAPRPDAAPAPARDLDQHRPHARRLRRVVIVGIAILGAMSVLINVSLAVSYHYIGPWAPEHVSAPFLTDAIHLYGSVPGGHPAFRRVAGLALPPTERGTFAVVGDCAGIYWSGGDIPSLAWSPWRAVARGGAAGRYDFTVTFPTKPPPRGSSEPLVIRGRPGHLQTLAVIYQGGNAMQFGLASEGHDDLRHGPRSAKGFVVDKITHYQPGRPVHMIAVMDPYNGQVRIDLDGKVVYRFFQVELTPKQNSTYIFPTSVVAFGRNDVGAPTRSAFSGTLRRVPTPRPSRCRDFGLR